MHPTTDTRQSNARQTLMRHANLVQTITERLLLDSVQLRVAASYGQRETVAEIRARMQRDVAELSILEGEAEPELGRAVEGL